MIQPRDDGPARERRERRPEDGDGAGAAGTRFPEESGAIRSRIEDTRAEMDRTLDELYARLHPRRLLDDVIDALRSDSPRGQELRRRAASAAGRVRESVRTHPMPFALIGAGVVWLLVHREPTEGEETFVATKARAAKQRAKEMGARAAGAARELKSAAGQQVRRRYTAAKDQLSVTVEEHPLAAGAGAFALGILSGLALPSTPVEDRTIGKAADKTREKVRAKGEELMAQGARVAAATAEAASSKLEEESGRSGGSAADTARNVAHAAIDAAAQAAQAAQSQRPSPSTPPPPP